VPLELCFFGWVVGLAAYVQVRILTSLNFYYHYQLPKSSLQPFSASEVRIHLHLFHFLESSLFPQVSLQLSAFVAELFPLEERGTAAGLSEVKHLQGHCLSPLLVTVTSLI
jgi:hypothetical protein